MCSLVMSLFTVLQRFMVAVQQAPMVDAVLSPSGCSVMMWFMRNDRHPGRPCH